MTQVRVLASIFCLLVCQTSRADLTLRHSVEVKFGAQLPPDAIEAIKKQMTSDIPTEVVTRVKGDKVYSKSGLVTSIMDCGTDQITLLHAGSRRYATVPMADYPGVRQQPTAISPEAARMFQDLRFDVQSKKTGRTGMLQGIRADEYEIVISMEMPGPERVLTGFSLTIQQWIANPEEAGRIPAIREFAGYSAQVRNKTNSYDMIGKVFSQFPGMGEKLRAPLEEMMNNNGSLVLKMRVAARTPGMAELGLDPDAPLFELNMNMVEISTAAVPNALFETPKNYQTAPLEELLSAAMLFQPVPTAKTYGRE